MSPRQLYHNSADVIGAHIVRDMRACGHVGVRTSAQAYGRACGHTLAGVGTKLTSLLMNISLDSSPAESLILQVNTNLQLSLLTLTLGAPIFGFVDHIALQCLWGMTSVTTLWSFGHYLLNSPVTVLKK